jgi:hypothetical protein
MRPKGLSFMGLMLRMLRGKYDRRPTAKESRLIRIKVLNSGAHHPSCHCKQYITDDCPVHPRISRVHLSQDL